MLRRLSLSLSLSSFVLFFLFCVFIHSFFLSPPLSLYFMSLSFILSFFLSIFLSLSLSLCPLLFYFSYSVSSFTLSFFPPSLSLYFMSLSFILSFFLSVFLSLSLCLSLSPTSSNSFMHYLLNISTFFIRLHTNGTPSENHSHYSNSSTSTPRWHCSSTKHKTWQKTHPPVCSVVTRKHLSLHFILLLSLSHQSVFCALSFTINVRIQVHASNKAILFCFCFFV